jgi:hypothetical protein
MGSAPNAVIVTSDMAVQLTKPGLSGRRVKNNRIIPLSDLRPNVLLVS